MSKAASILTADAAVKNGRKRPVNGSYGAVEAILHEHTRDIGNLETGLAQLGRDVEELKGTNGAILAKLDRLAETIAKTPHVPAFKEIAATVGAVVFALGAFSGLVMWFQATMFEKYAAPLKSAQELAQQAQRYEMDALKNELHFLQSSIRWKPELREYSGR